MGQKPKSLQAAGNKEGYKRRFGEAAAKIVARTPHFVGGRLYLRVVYFYRKDIRIDVDNIIKPIADGLREVVYPDDGVVTKCCAHKVDLNGPAYVIADDALTPSAYAELLALIGTQDHVLVVEVGSIASDDVAFGPIDGKGNSRGS